MNSLAMMFLLAASERVPAVWIRTPLGLLIIAVITMVAFVALKRRQIRKMTKSQFLFAGRCPSPEHWQDFLKGRLLKGDHFRMAAHLEHCDPCQRRMEELVAGKKSWSGLAPKFDPRPPAPDPELQKIMAQLKAEEKAIKTADQPVLRADLPLGFLDPPEKPGQLGRLGRYEILEEIGRGGMGIVLKAIDPTLQRTVAIKVLSPHLATTGVARKRFMREAQAAAAVTHDHVVTIHAVEEANGLPHLVMHYVAGMSLQDRIDKGGTLELKEILRIGMQTASGLAAAHAQGLVHRDIKPGNILLENGVQRVKITDFGLARAVDDASLTQSGFVAGSPQFMAPEQARGETIDHRSDLFSLGSVLYTMCTGRPPFRASTTLAVLRRVSDEIPRPIREINPEIPEWLESIIAKLHAKNPDDRFQTAAEVAQLLEQQLAQLQNGSLAAAAPIIPMPPRVGADAGLLTSFTLCPSCGAQLHVPETWLGTTVDCPECGKPFRVEEGSEEIQIARPVKARTIARVGRRRRHISQTWPWFVVGGVFLFLLLFFVGWTAHAPIVREATVSVDHGTATATIAPMAEETLASAVAPLPWYALYWFPEDASFFGAIDLRKFGSLTLDHEFTQTALKKTLSPEIQRLVTTDNLGKVWIDFLGFAYYEDRLKPQNSRIFLRLSGEVLAGRKRLREFFQKNISDVQLEENPPSHLQSYTIIHSPKMPFAVCLVGDTDIILAGFTGKKESREQVQVVKQILPVKENRSPSILHGSNLPWQEPPGRGNRQPMLLNGNQPPWLRNALKDKSPNSCAVLYGEIPEEVRTGWMELGSLPAIPRFFEVQMIRGRTGAFAADFSDSNRASQRVVPNGVVSIKLGFHLEKAGAADQFAQSIADRQKQGISAWKNLSVNWNIPLESFEPINRILGNLRVETKGEMVDGRVRITPEEWKAFWEKLQ